MDGLIETCSAWYRRAQKRASSTVPWTMIEVWAAPLLIAIFVVCFYAPPILSDQASIHWDAADVHYPLQHYFAARVRIGIPFWTPYLFSGYPILANPEVEAWYLPNWPFYILGFRPGSVEGELALHAFLACLGAYLFFSRMGMRSSAAMLGGLAYGLSGFFAGHSSHVPVFLAAAWFPWLLWAYRRAADIPGASNIAGGALAGGAMILAGYYQVAILGFLGLFCYAATDVWFDHSRRRRASTICGGIVAGALALAAIQVLPAAELVFHSAADPPNVGKETLTFRSLATLVLPDAAGTISGKDKGLITDHYLYAGLVLLPLAVVGAMRSRKRPMALVLCAFGIWYMLGTYAGLYWVGTWLPGKMMAGPPDIAWFLPALALSWLAALGSDGLFRHRPLPGILLVAVVFGDLWYWNLLQNPLAYARESFDSLYGEAERNAGRILAAPLLPLTRFDADSPPAGAGPLMHPLDLKLEATYGFFILRPRPYVEYREAMAHNRKLRDGLNVSRYLDSATGLLVNNASFLPRAYFPRRVRELTDETQSLAALADADQAAGSTVLGEHTPIRQDADGIPFVASYDEQSYRVHYRASSPSLLKLSETWYPGWRARIDGSPAPVLRVDHAQMGIVAPAGEHMVEFRFHSNWFIAGMAISLAALLSLVIVSCDLHAYVWKRIRMRMV